MRLLIRYCLPWGNFRTKGVDLNEKMLVSSLKEHIERIFSVPKSLQILKIKKSGLTLRLVDHDPLSFYEIGNKNQIFVERANSSEKKNVSRVRFLQRLGIGSVIQEEAEKEAEEEEKENENLDASFGSSGEENSSVIATEDARNREEIERHFSLIADNMCYEIQMSDRFEQLDELINKASEGIEGGEQMKGLFQKAKYTVWSRKGKAGESPVHKVIMLNRVSILQEMLANGLDINAECDDGYTPVQLAILCEKVEIFKIFLSHPSFRLDHVSEKGTPLHTAIQNGKFEFIELLLLHGVDTTVRDSKGFTALEVCDSEDIKRFVEAKIKQRENITKSMPPKPRICSGYLWKTGVFFKNLRKRYLVIDPVEGTISRFKTKEDKKPM